MFVCCFSISTRTKHHLPYNPDSNTDSLIGASDLVDFLPFYGEEFTEPLTIEGLVFRITFNDKHHHRTTTNQIEILESMIEQNESSSSPTGTIISFE